MRLQVQPTTKLIAFSLTVPMVLLQADYYFALSPPFPARQPTKLIIFIVGQTKLDEIANCPISAMNLSDDKSTVHPNERA